MDYSIVIAIAIGALGALIAAIVSREITIFQLDQKFGFSLFHKRIDSYAALYEILSDFIRILEFGKISSQGKLECSISKADIVQFIFSIESWNSKNSIFVTGYTTDIFYALRKVLYEILDMDNEQVEEQFNRTEIKKSLQEQVVSLTVAIKNEIGVYSIRPFPTNKEFNKNLLQMLPN